MTEERKNSRIGYINQSSFGDNKLYGTLYWGEKKYRLNNFMTNGETTVADVQEKTDETYVAKNGNEYNVYKNVGAIRFNREKGDGEFVTEMAGENVKYAFTSAIEEINGNPSRVIRFSQSNYSDNKFRSAFETAMEVASEAPIDEKVADSVPF